ncbi:hypothetical protein ASPZODRAFT_133076 [Penicilliopsis zonata CBS 506.65]|uniref:AB hydrolase-1 domain-containing protein n=1 Tax=Penicilliopsis zonata CBS 506.65 TaxID=1073090 RepID=A0A1L9SFZ5_9EURO|nr:hypothetical protein ASPZODRAFT_133076 [Penicilliopsis zonata CBS 506.65]OJJ46091.1 hypothetical protein ASPZODRAFT_133076 [Penicilliopsis zonata CBS 506.65]
MTSIQRRSIPTLGPLHPPNVEKHAVKPSIARHVQIRVSDPLDHSVQAILHEPHSYNAMQASYDLSTFLFKLTGLRGIYTSLADKLAVLLSIPCIRLDYRQPGTTQCCIFDILGAFTYLSRHFSSSRFVLVGWSFGGAPCFTVASREPQRVRGVATIASQTAGTVGITKLAPRPVLLLHGTGDRVLSYLCAKSLYHEYGTEGQREMELYEGDDHGLTMNAPEAEQRIFKFVARCLELESLLDREVSDKARQDLVESREERIREMEMGRDLEGGEKI